MTAMIVACDPSPGGQDQDTPDAVETDTDGEGEAGTDSAGDVPEEADVEIEAAVDVPVDEGPDADETCPPLPDLGPGVATVCLDFEVNGGTMPDAMGSNPRPRGVVRLVNVADGSNLDYYIGPSGPADFRIALAGGEYAVSVRTLSMGTNPGTPLPLGMEYQVPDILEVSSSTWWSMTEIVDLPVSDIVGEVLMSGETVPDDMIPGRSRGTISFDSGWLMSAASDLGSSGPARFTVRLYDGSYNVSLINSESYLLPRIATTLASGFLVDGSAEVDFDLPMIALNGEVTLNGESFPFDGTTGSTTWARLVFYKTDGSYGGNCFYFFRDGPALYQIGLYRVPYDIELIVDASRGLLPQPIGESRLLAEGIVFAGSGRQDFDLSVGRTSIEVTRNGTGMPGNTLDPSGTRGFIRIVDVADGMDAFDLDIGSSGPVYVSTLLYSGQYFAMLDSNDVGEIPVGATHQDVLPPLQAIRLGPDFSVGPAESLDLSYDVAVFESMLEVVRGGSPLPDNTDPSGHPRGYMLVRPACAGCSSILEFSLETSGPVSLRTLVYGAQAYDVSLRTMGWSYGGMGSWSLACLDQDVFPAYDCTTVLVVDDYVFSAGVPLVMDL